MGPRNCNWIGDVLLFANTWQSGHGPASYEIPARAIETRKLAYLSRRGLCQKIFPCYHLRYKAWLFLPWILTIFMCKLPISSYHSNGQLLYTCIYGQISHYCSAANSTPKCPWSKLTCCLFLDLISFCLSKRKRDNIHWDGSKSIKAWKRRRKSLIGDLKNNTGILL